MKKLFLLALFAFGAVMAFATDPAKFLPSDAGVVVYLDGRRFAQKFESGNLDSIPAEHQAKINEFKAVLQKHSLSSTQFFSGAFFLVSSDKSKENVSILFNTAISENSMQKVLKDAIAQCDDAKNVQYRIVKSGKYVIYAFWDADDLKDQQALCFTYVANDVVLMTMMNLNELSHAEQSLQTLGGGSPLLEKLDRSQLLSIYCDLNQLDVSSAEIQKYGFDKIAVSGNLLGENQDDAKITVQMACIDQQHLKQLGMQFGMTVPMMLNMAFCNDPSIGAELMQGFSLQSQDNVLTFSLQVSAELSKRIDAYMAKPENHQPANFNGF